MRNIYIKTTWVDNGTPVNAANLNKIENAISDLYNTALSSSDLAQGDGIKISTTSDKKLEFSVSNSVLRSNTATGVEFIYDELEVYKVNCIYFILDQSTKKLKKIIINGVTIYEVE